MSAAQPIAELPRERLGDFAREAVQAFRPVVMRGLAADWPLLAAASGGAVPLADYLARFDRGKDVEVMTAPADVEGRFFHAPDMRGFNFRIGQARIGQLLSELARLGGEPKAPGLYAGAILAADHLPGLIEANPLPLDLKASDAMPRVWLGNASYVSPHFDLSDNVAVVVGGRRRFTLYPPEQTRNLYVGPFNMTPAGQPVSMVDPRDPDLARYPRFAEAMAASLSAELEPGDAIYIPTLWWHGVEALEPVNMLVNYWHNHPQDGGAFLALVHALAAVRDEPRPRRDAWRAWFDHFIFGDEADHAADHLPLHAKGVLGPASKNRAEAIRTYLLRALSRG
jgi:hypothetical protein